MTIGQILQFILAFLMLGMGMTLSLADFKRVTLQPKATLTGLVSQVVFLPILGAVIVALVPMPVEIAVGLMIIAICPGGATSNLISHLAKGDLALSITMTALSSVITVFTIPFILNFTLEWLLGAGKAVKLDIMTTIQSLTLLTIVPVIIGMFIKAYLPQFARLAEKPVNIASLLFILFAVILIIYNAQKSGSIVDLIYQAGLATVLLNGLAMLYGFYLPVLVGLSLAQRITISIEVGIQNNVLGIYIATQLLNNPAMGTAAAVYAFVMCTSGFVAIYFFRKMSLINQNKV
jgi:bile acid:Na+ symporter, BASS family